MSNLAIDTALKASNFLNLISIHSKDVVDNIIRNSDLNGAIVTGSQNVWNIFDFRQMLQNNNGNNYLYYLPNGLVMNNNKSNATDHGVRILIKYRE